jgi:hypothetical protein
MVKLYIAILQDSLNFKLVHHHAIVALETQGTPLFYEKRLGWCYQTLTVKSDKGGPGLDMLIESTTKLSEHPVEFITGRENLETVLKIVGERVDKHITEARALGQTYEYLWQRREHSYPAFPISFPDFPECSSVARVSLKCVQWEDQRWWTVHEWEKK